VEDTSPKFARATIGPTRRIHARAAIATVTQHLATVTALVGPLKDFVEALYADGRLDPESEVMAQRLLGFTPTYHRQAPRP
jgi:hypothetical protein